MIRLAFIVGPPRSGTSLLQRLLAEQPGIATSPETDVFALLTPSFGRFHSLPPVWQLPIPSTISAQKVADLVKRVGVRTGKDLVALEATGQSMRTQDFLNKTFELLAGPHASWFLEKTPNHAYYVSQIRRFYPRAPIFWILRDPRDTAASVLSSHHKWANRRLAEVCMQWNASLPPKPLPPYTTVVRYEDLALAPSKIVAIACSEVGFPFRKISLEEARLPKGHLARPDEYHKDRVFGPISNRVGVFEAVLPQSAAFEIEYRCQRGMSRWGYRMNASVRIRRAWLAQSVALFFARIRRAALDAAGTLIDPH